MPPHDPTIKLAEITAAAKRLGPPVRLTPLEPSSSLAAELGQAVWLKLECWQCTGSFKLRGAMNAVAQLSPAPRARGVVGVSTGNHGRALAYAARHYGSSAVVCLSSLVPPHKVTAITDLGAQVIVAGESQEAADACAVELIAEQGRTMLPPFDHRAIIAGQGTIGLEILAQVRALATTVDCVVVPVSGGGLAAGLAVALKSQQPGLQVIGVGAEQGCAMYHSQRAGRPVDIEERATLADALVGGIGADNRYTFALVRDWVDQIVLVSDEQIRTAIRHAYHHARLIVEGSGAVGIAALLAGKIPACGKTVIVVSGANIDMTAHQHLINGD